MTTIVIAASGSRGDVALLCGEDGARSATHRITELLDRSQEVPHGQ